MNRSRLPRDVAFRSCRRCQDYWPVTQRGLCYECVLRDKGRKPTERHHPFGRDNPAVAEIDVAIPGNWHRMLDSRRAQRPEILKRPGDNPLHQIAAAVATFGEVADAVADVARHQGWPEWIAQLADVFARGAESTTDWLLDLAGRLDEWLGTAGIGEMPQRQQ